MSIIIPSNIVLLILGAFLLDMFFTYRLAQAYKNKFPDRDWTTIEANPIIRYSWRKMGLISGSCISGIIISIILFTILQFTSENWHYFFFGIYSMMCVFHYTNFKALERIKK